MLPVRSALVSAGGDADAACSGITGQDGSYLTELLLAKGYTVHGIIRRSSSFNTGRIEHLYKDLHESRVNLILHYGDLTDTTNLVYIISQTQPTEIYNLAAQSHVKVSFDMAEYTGDVDGLGTLRLLDAIRTCGLTNHIRFYQASTSELYGKVVETPQTETTPFYPRSPYGVAKLYGFWIVKNYRESYDMYACNGILFNHESPRRGALAFAFPFPRLFPDECLCRTHVRHPQDLARRGRDQPRSAGLPLPRQPVGQARLGPRARLRRGDVDDVAARDPGRLCPRYGRDASRSRVRPGCLRRVHGLYAEVAVRKSHRFVEKAFAVVGVTIKWQGQEDSVDEVGVDAKTGQVLVRVDVSSSASHLIGPDR